MGSNCSTNYIPYPTQKYPFSWKASSKKAFCLSCSFEQFNAAALLQDCALSASESLPEELPESESATNLTISHFFFNKSFKEFKPHHGNLDSGYTT